MNLFLAQVNSSTNLLLHVSLFTSLPTRSELLLWAAPYLLKIYPNNAYRIEIDKVYYAKESIDLTISFGLNDYYKASASKIDLETVKTLESYLTHANPEIRKLAKRRIGIPE